MPLRCSQGAQKHCKKTIWNQYFQNLILIEFWWIVGGVLVDFYWIFACQCLFPVRLPVYDTWFRFHSAFLLASLLVRSQTPAARSQTTHKIWTRAKQNNALHVLYFTGLWSRCFWVSLGSFRVMLDILDPTWPNLAQLESQDRSRWPQVAPTWANLAPDSPKIGPTWANLGQLGPQILDFWRILRVMLAPKIDKK